MLLDRVGSAPGQERNRVYPDEEMGRKIQIAGEESPGEDLPLERTLTKAKGTNLLCPCDRVRLRRRSLDQRVNTPFEGVARRFCGICRYFRYKHLFYKKPTEEDFESAQKVAQEATGCRQGEQIRAALW